jgi:hypothetical protein
MASVQLQVESVDRIGMVDMCAAGRSWPDEPSPAELDRALIELAPKLSGERWEAVTVDGPHVDPDDQRHFYWFRYRRL